MPVSRGASETNERAILRRGGQALLVSWLFTWSLLVISRQLTSSQEINEIRFIAVTNWTTVTVIGSVGLYVVLQKTVAASDRRFIQLLTLGLMLALIGRFHNVIREFQFSSPRTPILIVMYVGVVTICLNTLIDRRIPLLQPLQREQEAQ